MKRSLHIRQEPNLQKVVITSAVLHILFLTLITIPIKSKNREYKSYFVNLVAPAEVRRDIRTTGAPQIPPSKSVTKKKVTKEKGTVTMKAPPRKRAAPEKGVSLEPDNPAEIVSREIERLRALKALSQRKKKRDEALSRAKKQDTELAAAIDVIRKKARGGVSKGPGVPAPHTSTDINPYLALVQQKIWSEWIHPEFDSGDLQAIVSFHVDRQGNIVSPRMVRSSGNDLFDHSVMKAIKKAGPLPPPPVEDEFEVRFHL